jgi:hypothetical protein
MTRRLLSLLLRLRRRADPDPIEAPLTRLTCCPACRSTMVVPVAWEDVGHACYLRLRCGQCGRRRLVLVDEERLRRYGLELDRLEDELVRSMAPLRRHAADADATALAEAVHAELLDPSDLAP